MAIYRGPGGSGDATTDAQNEASIASTKATEAAASAAAAAASATQAATSETNAGTSATNAQTSANSAASSATSASTSATNASTSASAASTSATNAATSASNASTSETNAAASASAAATSATNAATSETNAANSASAASTSATNAATSETNAAASYDSFDDRYLGAKSSAPTVDNDGDPLLTGALYWNSTDNKMYVWNGSTWTITAGGATILDELTDVTITTPTTNQVLKYNGSIWVNGNDTDTGILYTDLSVTTAAAGSPALSYNNTNGVFTYTPPDLTSYITASSTDTFTNKSGNISQWTNDSGYLTSETYTGTVTSVAATVPVGFTIAGSPVTTSGTLAISFDTGYSLPTTASQTNWNTAYGWGNHASAGYLTSFTETNDLTAAVTWANVPDANITQTSVTQHQAALSITESQISDLGTYLTSADAVTKTSATGSGVLPAGTTAQRDVSPAAGYIRFNNTTTGFEGYDGSAWGAIGGGASAGGAIYENNDTITTSYTIAAGKNGHSVGPITLNSGVSVTISSGQRWVIA
jgi:hypothetical protein